MFHVTAVEGQVPRGGGGGGGGRRGGPAPTVQQPEGQEDGGRRTHGRRERHEADVRQAQVQQVTHHVGHLQTKSLLTSGNGNDNRDILEYFIYVHDIL